MGLGFRKSVLILNTLILIVLIIMSVIYCKSPFKTESKPHETNVILYDRTNKTIVQYRAFFEYKDDTVMLYDADVIQEEHDDEWDNIIK